LAQSIAERIAVDAREAGLTIKIQTPTGLAPRPDARIVRVRLPVAPVDRAFAGAMARIAQRTTADTLMQGWTPGMPFDALYGAETALLDRAVIVPIVHVPDIYGVAEHVLPWQSPAILGSGEWNFADVWLRSGKP